MYLKYFKRPLDFILSLLAFAVLSPLLLILSLVGAVMMKGNPFFTQRRPGKSEKIFKLIKFRTMTCEEDENGQLLADDIRLTGYGKFLRATSLDELPELINIIKGEMSIIGPRPQLVRDMVFMTPEQRKRHTVRPGLTGLAQSSGRNGITWDDKLKLDLEYIDNTTFLGDIKILINTVKCVFAREGITEEGMATAADFGDYLLSIGSIEKEEYDAKLSESKELIAKASK